MGKIQIVQIDINEYIKALVDKGESKENVIYALYDGRVNGIDTFDKCEEAYAAYLIQSAGQGDTL